MTPNNTVECPYCGMDNQIALNPGDLIYPRCKVCKKQFEVELPEIIVKKV